MPTPLWPTKTTVRPRISARSAAIPSPVFAEQNDERDAELARRERARGARRRIGAIGVGEVDLVDHDRRRHAAVGEGDEEAVDQADGERRLAQRDDDDREVDVGGEDALAMGEERIRPGQPVRARQDLRGDEIAGRAARRLAMRSPTASSLCCARRAPSAGGRASDSPASSTSHWPRVIATTMASPGRSSLSLRAAAAPLSPRSFSTRRATPSDRRPPWRSRVGTIELVVVEEVEAVHLAELAGLQTILLRPLADAARLRISRCDRLGRLDEVPLLRLEPRFFLGVVHRQSSPPVRPAFFA